MKKVWENHGLELIISIFDLADSSIKELFLINKITHSFTTHR